VETAKFLVPLNKDVKKEYNKKIIELGEKLEWKKVDGLFFVFCFF
jgi:hypothetical protein